MTTTATDPILTLVQQISEVDLTLRAVDHTDNQGEPCEYCAVIDHVNMVTLHGFGQDGEHGTADCCVHCITVAQNWFNPLYSVVAEVAR